MSNNPNNESKKTANRLPVFYIALCCCVLAIGVAGYISDSLTSSETGSVSSNADAYTPRPVYTISPTVIPEPTEEIILTNEYVQEESVPVYDEVFTEDYTFDNPDIIEVNADAEVYETVIIPIEGEIYAPYTETPYFNEVLCDWRTHNGIDIAAKEGDNVFCSANGEVSDISETIYGTQITVSHNDGFETVYSQLIADTSLQVDSNVRCGDILGTVTAPKGEPVTDAHLHFEVKHNGNYINPFDYVSD